MSAEQLSTTGGSGRRHRSLPRQAEQRATVRVASLNRRVSEARALDEPELMMLVGEDCCWRLSVTAWKRRRPWPWRIRGRRAWHAEGRVLREKEQRLRELGAELGLPRAARRPWPRRLGWARGRRG